MKKKVARVLFAFVLILAMIPLTASAESSADTEDNEVTEQFDLATVRSRNRRNILFRSHLSWQCDWYSE